jgi:small-conductance mechanosensitive channel
MGDFIHAFQVAIAVPAVRALVVLLVSVVAAKLIELLLCRALLPLTLHTETDLDDRLIKMMHKPIFFSVLLIGLYVALGMFELDPFWRNVSTAAIVTFAILIWTITGLKFSATLLKGLSSLADRVTWLEARTLPLFDNLAKVVLFGAAVYALLVVWRLDVKPWLASAGIAGIAIGFAAKDSLANLFGGLFIIIDAPYKIGDFVNLDSGERGQVTKIGLRSTRLLTRDDIEITLPNAQIANSKIVNESGGRWLKSRVSIDVSVAYGSDIDRVREILIGAARSVKHVVDKPAPRVRFRAMGDSALLFRLMCWIDEPVMRGRTIDGLNTAVYRMLTAERINIPFPQREVHVRRDSAAGDL